MGSSIYVGEVIGVVGSFVVLKDFHTSRRFDVQNKRLAMMLKKDRDNPNRTPETSNTQIEREEKLFSHLTIISYNNNNKSGAS